MAVVLHVFAKASAPFVLPVLGCILISAAAFTVAPGLGLLVAGIACFFVEWRISAERQDR